MAQDCDCDYTITASQGYIRATDVPAVKPGSTVCIKAGVRGRLKLIGFQGTKDQPITFKNCGGQVIFDNPDIDGTFVFESCKYFRVTGTGDSRHEFGFLIRNAGKGSAMYVTESDFELDHIEIADAGFAGIMAKIDPSCDNTQYHRQNFVMRNVSIHDNYIHHTYGEGMYIGSTSYTGKSLPCGTALPHLIEGLRVFNNRVEYTDADGIQVSSAVKDVEVFNNTIYRYGQDPFKSFQNNGLMIGGGANGKYYNNKIIEGTGMGINCFGLGNVYIYNNLVVKPDIDGIFIDERSDLTPNTGFHAHNNTVVSPGRDGIRMYSRKSVGSTFNNNLLVAPASLSINYYNKDQYLYIIDNTVKYTQSNNLFIATVKDAMFADPATNNYQLLEQSPAVEKGMQLNYFNFDLNRTPRPQGNNWDVGAYEYSGAMRNSNRLPVVSAGDDQTLTLPANSLSLQGSASDADGSLASTSWTKVSGPAATMSGSSSLKLSLSNLVEGTYTFRLTATDNNGASSQDDVNVKVTASGESTGSTSNAPSDVSAKMNSNGSISLKWIDNSSNEKGFEIWVRTASTSYKQMGATTYNKTSYTVGNLSARQVYYVKVRAKFSSSSFSVFSPEVSTDGSGTGDNNENTGTTDAKAPSNVTAKMNSNGSMSLSWKDNSSNEKGFEIWVRTSSTSYKQMGATTYNKTSYTVGNLSASTTYWVKLRAKYSGTSFSAYSPEVSTNGGTSTTNTTDDQESKTGSMAAPTALSGKVNAYYSAVGLSWQDNSNDEDGFEIQMSTGGTSGFKAVGSTGPNKTSYTVNVSKGQAYYFRVRAKAKGGIYSAYSNQLMADATSSSTARVTDNHSIQQLNGDLTASPNPASNYVDVQLSEEFSGNVQVQLLDMTGRVQISEIINAGQQNVLRLDLSRQYLKPGMYLIMVMNGLQRHTIKLLKD